MGYCKNSEIKPHWFPVKCPTGAQPVAYLLVLLKKYNFELENRWSYKRGKFYFETEGDAVMIKSILMIRKDEIRLKRQQQTKKAIKDIDKLMGNL